MKDQKSLIHISYTFCQLSRNVQNGQIDMRDMDKKTVYNFLSPKRDGTCRPTLMSRNMEGRVCSRVKQGISDGTMNVKGGVGQQFNIREKYENYKIERQERDLIHHPEVVPAQT